MHSKFKESSGVQVFNEHIENDIYISAMLNNNLVQPHNL